VTTHTRDDLPHDRSEEDPPERPSKSQRKRDAHAAQDLGEELIGLRDAELDALGLPERLVEAIRAARRIKSRAGGARQRQYIGKLMREIDPEPIRATLAARSERDAIETQLFKRAESWRERLLGQGQGQDQGEDEGQGAGESEGEAALDELARLRPGLDRAEWSRRIAAARREVAARERGAAERPRAFGPAGRELFRALRALLG